ncbi:membrane-spanning 4-domains subfamily A member 12-like [Clarias gariepinus]|uniref:membrane-spanning 4-domains subfamily A member 12-like n=1 Tax=Clarias gariepinus TaxID=13013 RepID=UPI00234E1AF4|nr:membrane-spanning 4-domains subfamily A member 12-like [Clarias gariepinus]
MTPGTTTPNPQLSQLSTFMKAEPKALGTVQIMIGVFTLLFGIIIVSMVVFTPAVISGITLWGSFLFITSGALSVAAANNTNSCVVKAALGMNVVSAVTAGLALILFAVDMILGSMFSYECHRSNYDSRYQCISATYLWTGIYGVLFFFSLLELIISIRTSCFACKATKYTETTVECGGDGAVRRTTIRKLQWVQ